MDIPKAKVTPTSAQAFQPQPCAFTPFKTVQPAQVRTNICPISRVDATQTSMDEPPLQGLRRSMSCVADRLTSAQTDIQQQLEVAKKFFNGFTWADEPGKTEDAISVSKGKSCKTHLPGLFIKTPVNVDLQNVYQCMLDNIDQFAKWLPIMDTMQIIDKKPDEGQYTLGIKTKAYTLGRGVRTGLLRVIMNGSDDNISIHIQYIPTSDKLYAQHDAFKTKPMKAFETLMQFTTHAQQADRVHLQYQNFTDPNLPRLPGVGAIFWNSAVDNHSSFVHNCVQALEARQTSHDSCQ